MTISQRGIFYGLLAAAIWGGMYIVSDLVLPIVPPFLLLTIRLMLGAIVLALLVYTRRSQLRRPSRVELFHLMGVGFLGFGISVGAQFVGTDESTAVNGALITSAAPAFILVFAARLLKEQLTLQRITAVLLASIGVLIIVDPTQIDFSSAAFRGNVALAAAAITWGLYSVLVRKVSAQVDTLIVTLVGFLGGLLLTIPAAALESSRRPVGSINALAGLGILYLGVISTAGAMWLWNRAFALVDASTASLCFFAQPLVGAILGVLIGQPLTPSLWIGGLLISLGVLLALRPSRRIPVRCFSSGEAS
jgi:drug/metabolite transporter (DMT)-like permease